MNKTTLPLKLALLAVTMLIINISAINAQTSSSTRAERLNQIQREITTLKSQLSDGVHHDRQATEQDLLILKRLDAYEQQLVYLQSDEGARLLEDRLLIERLTGYRYGIDGRHIAEVLRESLDDNSPAYELLTKQAAFESSFHQMSDQERSLRSKEILNLHKIVVKNGSLLIKDLSQNQRTSGPPTQVNTGNALMDEQNHIVAKDKWISENEEAYKQLLEQDKK